MDFKKIIVTGSAGFIGFHLSRTLLDRGLSVVGVDNMTDYYDVRMKEKRNEILTKYKSFSFYKISVADHSVFSEVIKKEKPDIIIHLAAQAGVRYSLINPWSYVESNYLSTLNIFESTRSNNIKRVLIASTGAVYGNNKKQPFSENDPTETPISLYGATKKASELLAYTYHHLYGIEVGIMRFFTAYGIYGRPDLALFKFSKNITAGKPISVYNHGDMIRTFTHIEDVVDGVISLMNKEELSYDKYNFSGSDQVKLSDFVEMIEESLGKKAIINYLPMQAGDIKEAVVDISKAKKELGYNPKKNIKDGVKEFTKWFSENVDWLSKLDEPK